MRQQGGVFQSLNNAWQVLVVDDQQDHHDLINDFMLGKQFAGRPFAFTSAHSATEAREILQQRDDFAVVILDICMETARAGLDLARQIREEMGNRFLRIIMATAYSDEAPEHEVINAYDVNDYYDKAHPDAHKLHTMLSAALRSWREMSGLRQSREGLARAIEASGDLLEFRNSLELINCAVNAMPELLDGDQQNRKLRALAVKVDVAGQFELLATSGVRIRPHAGNSPLPFLQTERMNECWRDQHHIFRHDWYCGYVPEPGGNEYLIYVEADNAITGNDSMLLELYLGNLRNAIARQKRH